jgi:hypothetical protein
MADPTSVTNPLAPGGTTSEGAGSKVVVIIASVIAALGTITTVLESVSAVVPASTKGLGLWLAIGGAVVAGLTQIAYTVQRGLIKVAAIKAGGAVPPDPTPAAASTAAANLGK